MSAVGILGNAVSGLQTSQAAIRHTSNNIANANNPDFARRSIIFQTRALGGVEVAEIRRIADDFLTRESYNVTASAKAAEIAVTLHDRLQSVLGDPSSNNSIASKIDGMFAALSELQIEPASGIRRGTAINSVQIALDELDKIAGAIQQIRSDADQNILNRVGAVNDLIKNIGGLNLQIVSASVLNGDPATLVDQREKSLKALSAIMDIRVSLQSDGQAFVSTADGVFLVGASLTELQYSASATVNPDTVFPRITVHNIDSSSGLVSAAGLPAETHILSGELRGLLDMRDITLPKIAEEIGELASKLTDQLNAIHNDNSAVPAPNQLSGSNTGLLTADAHGFSGVSNFSIIDASGRTVVSMRANFSTNQYSVNGGAAVAFAGGSIADMVGAINAGLGASGSLSFSGGVMTLGATNPAHGVAMVQDSVSPSSRAGRGFAHFFGMNDLVRGAVPSHYETGLAAGAAHGFTAGGTAQFKLIDNVGQVLRDFTFTVAGATIGDVVTQLNAGLSPYGSFSLNAQGALVMTPAQGYENSTLFSVNDLTSRGATGVNLSQLFGIGPGARQKQAMGLEVRSSLVQNNNTLALAKLNVTAPGTVALGVSDERGALAFHALEGKLTNFSKAGHISSQAATLGDYSGQFLSNAARLASNAENISVERTGVMDEINSQISQVSGVNLDEELANLVVYQNAYNAAARMIKAADELFQTLLDAL